MQRSHLIRRAKSAVWLAAALLTGVTSAPAQPRESSFVVLARGASIGSEQVAVERTPQGWSISSTGRFGAPIDLTLKSLLLHYDADWRPLDLAIEATIRQQAGVLTTTVSGATAQSELTTEGAAPLVTRAQIDAASVLLNNPYVAPFEAVAARLLGAREGTSLPFYQPGGAAGQLVVGAIVAEQIQTVAGLVDARRVQINAVAQNGPPLALAVWLDSSGGLLRVSVPAQQLEFVREDLASVSARIVTMRRPNDEDVRIAANGFSLAGTLSKPSAPPSQPLPVVVLLGGSGPTDRDETVAGIPIFAHISAALADAGYAVLRYDKRGVGQSGGRVESATLLDFADDARAAVKFASERKDLDRRRITVVGHSEGGWVALLAARDNNRVAAVALLSTPGVTGANVNLYQVEHRLAQAGRPEAERRPVVDLQRKIQEAVVTGRGWEALQLAPGVRAQADTPYFQSFLTMDPSKAIREVSQPLFVLQGGLDRQIPDSSAEALATVARARKKASPVEVVTVPGVNHLLVPATTGEVGEYGSLSGRGVAPEATAPLVRWLQQALAARR